MKTRYGLDIYDYILKAYYGEDAILRVSGMACLPSKNPFRKNKETLLVTLDNGSFRYHDKEDKTFKGDPFKFAQLYFKLEGKELLQKIGEVLNISDNTIKTGIAEVPVFSLFRHPVSNIFPAKEVSLVELYLGIRSIAYKDRTNYLRVLKEKDQIRKYKASEFDYVTFSGTFTRRNDKALVNHSGLLTIDFDHIPNIPELKEKLLQDEYFETELLFISPSGDGLKWIIAIDLNEFSHQEWFLSVANYIKSSYGLEVDQSGKDISRACFLPYDPDIYINPIYLNIQKSDGHEKV
jgi:hypothetical protein